MTHPDLDTLADVAAGLRPDRAGNDVGEHLASCAGCREIVAAAAAPNPALPGLADVPLPPAIAARLDRVLAEEGAAPDSHVPTVTRTVTPLVPRRRRAWAGLAAASMVVIVGAAVGYGTLRGADTSSTTTAGAASTPGRATTVVSASNRDYTGRPSLVAALPSLLGQRANADSAVAAPAGAPVTPGSATSAAQQALARLRDPAALAACVTRLTGQRAVHPLALDYARFDGAPALVLVLPARSGANTVDVYVVSPSCGSNDPRYFARLPRS